MQPAKQLSAKTLGQIALIQSMVSHLPDQESILSFVKRGLEIIPGTDKIDYRITKQEVAEKVQFKETQQPFGSFPLKFDRVVYGELLFSIFDPELFEPYIPYLENLSHMLAVIFEERRQRSLNEAYRHELEKRVLIRTQQLEKEILKHRCLENALRLDEARLEALLKLSEMTDVDIKEISDYVLEEASRLTKSKIGYIAFTNADESVLTIYSWIGETSKLRNIGTEQTNYTVSEIGLGGEAIRQRNPIVNNNCTPQDDFKNDFFSALAPLIRYLIVPVFEGDHAVVVAGLANKPQDYDQADIRQVRLLMQGMWRLIQRRETEKEKLELERRLRQAYKMESIGTLAGGIAHDFNNILSAIFGYTELALDETPAGTSLKSNLTNVLDAAKRARDLVTHILTFSRQSDQEQLPVKLAPIVKEVNKFMRATLPASIEIRQKIQGDPIVMADPTQIHQVLMNLCTNAGQAMSNKGGILEIRLETMELDEEFTGRHPGLRPGVHVKLTISDTGHGIPPELMDRIFDPFFTTKERGQGTGMGLAVVHGAVRNYGGIITVYSSLEKGTAFNVFLPAIEQRISKEKREEKIPAGGIESILFVDDEKTLVDLGVMMLGALGYNVTGETSSLKAFEKFKETPDQFDLVITDLTMPELSGAHLAEELLKINPKIPIILCTGFSASINEEIATSMGIRAFIKKPILTQQISEIIRNVLDTTRF